MRTDLRAHHRLFLKLLAEPAVATDCSNEEWELLLRMAHKTRLLAHLGSQLERAGLIAVIPERVRKLLRASQAEVRGLQRQMIWELNRIDWALGAHSLPVVVLKGAAYELAGLPMSDSRHSADLDILVAREHIDAFETLLLSRGWAHPPLSAYDEHYYRVWSHELPAFVHRERSTEVDVHHTLAPRTSRLQVNAQLLFANAIATSIPRYRILCPVDMVLHCAINLFQNNELADDLRDLLDLDRLLRHFSARDPDFWAQLLVRADQLSVGKPLYYGLQFSRLILGTPVPDRIEDDLQHKPARVSRWLMGKCVPLALLPLHPDSPGSMPRIARALLYARSHWIRMPLHLLLVHVTYKSYVRLKTSFGYRSI